jgi:hypothetical protein
MEPPQPESITPEKLPNPWLADSEWLLEELAKVREEMLRVPVQLDNASNINSVIDRCWRLEKNLRFLLFLHRDGQRQFAKKALPKESRRQEMHREQKRVDFLRSQGKIRDDYKTALERRKKA